MSIPKKKHPLPKQRDCLGMLDTPVEPKIKSSSVTSGRVKRTGTHWGATRCFSQALLLCVGVMNPTNDCSIFPSLAPSTSCKLTTSIHHGHYSKHHGIEVEQKQIHADDRCVAQMAYDWNAHMENQRMTLQGARVHSLSLVNHGTIGQLCFLSHAAPEPQEVEVSTHAKSSNIYKIIM